jgi:general stress protein CsbA
MIQKSLRLTRWIGVVLVAIYLAVSAWKGYSLIYYLLKIAPLPEGGSAMGLMVREFAPPLVMCILLLLPWRRIRSEWLWWPLFVSLVAASCIHVQGSTYATLAGQEWLWPTHPFRWPSLLVVLILVIQLAAIICMRVLQTHDVAKAAD